MTLNEPQDMQRETPVAERKELEQAIAQLEAKRATLGDSIVDLSIAALQEKLAALEPCPPHEQRKQVSILFADVSGFTPMSETMDAEEVSDVINALWQQIDVAILENGGHIDKHIGDAVMALWGVDTAHESDPECAIRAGLAMQAMLAEFKTGHSLKMRIGVSTGPALLGTVGTTGEFSAIGDAVNLAQELEAAAPTSGVLISHDTYRHVRGVFDVLKQEPLVVKDKVEPVQTYLVQRAKPHAFRLELREIQGVETRMIGRDVELTALQDALNSAIVDRQTTLVTVLGEAGVGKSRLLYEFDNWLELRPQEVWHFKGRCTQQRQGVANGLLRDLLAYHFGIADSDPIDVVRGKLEAGIARFLPAEGETKAHYLGAWLGYDYEHSPHVAALRGDAQQLHNRASLYLGQFFEALTHDSPVVILLEDLHWADGGSLTALVDLCRRRPGLPLFILCLARPGLLARRPDWGSDLLETRYQQVDLVPLAETEARALVIEILQKVTQVPPILIELLVSRAEGNPYFVEELVQMLIDQEVICTGEERWRVVLEKLAELQVPATLTAVLQARLDRLSPPQKEALQQAAVVGRVFWDAVLAELGAGTDPPLAELAGRELVMPRRQSAFAGAAEYIFKHALLRDVTYETVLKRVRRAYHRLVGAWLVAAAEANGRTDEYAAIIGGHYEAAGETVVAAGWYGRAGKQAAGQFDQEVALKWLSRALDLTPLEERAVRFELLMAREGVYHLTGKREKQAADLARLAELAGVASETSDVPPVWAAQVLIRQAAYAGAVSDYPAAIGAASEALARAEVVADGKLAAAALVRLGDALWRQGEYATARQRYTDGQAQAAAVGARADLADNLKGLGNVAYEQGDYATARRNYEAALGMYREIGDRRRESACLGNLGLVAADQGDYAGARGYHEASLGIYREIGYRRGESICLNNLGVVARDQGDYARARGYHEASLGIYREIAYRRGESICLLNLGVVARNQEDYAGAREYYGASLAIAREVGYRSGEGLVLHDLGALAQAEGDLDGAEAYFHQALALHEELGQPQHMVEDQAGLAGVALERGEPVTARATLAPVLVYLAENPTLDGAMHPYRVPLICGRVLLALGELGQAREIVGAASRAWAALAEKLPTLAERERLWQVPEYEALRQLWAELAE
jgi:class 3 adenylate cyclase/tetratricopeptide (TPR) repeat protein